MSQMQAIEEVVLKPPVEAGDRLAFTVFMALVVHALVLLAPGFKLPDYSNQSPTIEITLATHKAARAPDQADYLAQHNQEASGTLDQAKQLTTDKQADFADTQVREVNPLPQQQAAAVQLRERQQISTTSDSPFRVETRQLPDEREQPEAREGQLEDQAPTSADIASLQAQLDRQRQEYARRPRIRTLNSVSTKASADAKYLHDWGQRIEQVGSRNYPREALNRRIAGQLRLSVFINPDGTIHEIAILQSSGQRLLDDAARQIVRLAVPFAPFPAEIRQHTDRLQIIRTWRFEINGAETSISTSAN